MRRLVKKVFSIFCVVGTLISLLAFNVSATSEVTDAENELIERGYPQNLINKLCDEEKIRLASLDGYIYAGGAIVRFNETTGEGTIVDADDDTIMPLGTIEDDELEYSFTFSYSPTKQELDVSANYEWHYIPLFRYQDPVSVSWSSTSGFSYEYNSFHKVDKADGYTKDPQGVVTYYNGHVHSESYVEYDSNSRGVMWFADLMGHQWFSATSLYGYGNFTLNCTSNPRGKTLYFNYIHSKMLNSGDPYLDDDGVAKMNGGSYDSMGNSVTISW